VARAASARDSDTSDDMAVGALQELEELFGVPPPTEELLPSMVETGAWREALALKAKMEKTSKGKPSANAYADFIEACVRGRQWRKALELFAEHTALGLQPVQAAFRGGLSALYRGGHWRDALEMFRRMRARGFPGDLACYKTAAQACRSALQWSMALELVKEALANEVVWQDTTISERLRLVGSGLTSCIEGRLTDSVMEMLEKLWRIGNKLPAESDGESVCLRLLTSVMQWLVVESVQQKAFKSSRNLEVRRVFEAERSHWLKRAARALAIFKEMREKGFVAGYLTFAAAVDLSRSVDSNGTVELLRDLRAAGHTPDEACYNDAIISCSGDSWPTSLELLEEMVASGLRPNPITYEFLAACTPVWQQALHWYSELREVSEPGSDILFRSWCSIIRKTCQSGIWAQALDLWHQPPAPPSDQAMNRMAAVLVRARKWEIAIDFLRSCPGLRAQPDAMTYMQVMQLCDYGGQWEWNIALLKEMKVVCGHEDLTETMEDRLTRAHVGGAYSAAISSSDRARQYLLAIEIFEELRSRSAQGITPALITMSIAFGAAKKVLQELQAASAAKDLAKVRTEQRRKQVL